MWIGMISVFLPLHLVHGIKVVDLMDIKDENMMDLALVEEGIEVEVFPTEQVYFPNESFSLCVRKYKEFGRYIDSMPFFSSDWNETINATFQKTHGFGYNERNWPNPTGLAVGEGCDCSSDKKITNEDMMNTGWYVEGGMGPMAKPHQWIHACNVYDASTQEYKLYFNGEQIPLEKTTMEHPRQKLNGTTRLWRIKIGSPVDNEKANLFLGKTTDINMYSRALSEDDVKSYAACNLTQGDLIAWNKTNITLNTARAQVLEMNLTDICNPGYHVLPLSVPSVSWHTSLETCEKLGKNSKLIQPVKEDVYNYMLMRARHSKAMSAKCSGNDRQRLWTATYWSSEDNEIYNIYTGENVSNSTINITAAFTGNRNKGKFVNRPNQSMIMYSHPRWKYGFAYWADSVISSNSPATCIPCVQHNKFKPHVLLRGLCEKTAFDQDFHFMLDDDGFMKLQGFKRSIIFFNFTLNMWQMQSQESPTAVAYSKSLRQDLALGLNTWTVSNDNECQIGEVEVKFKLTTCGKDEFTCSNGLCVSMQERCDSARHCDDWSDEIGCSLTKLPASYMKQFSPIQIINKAIVKVPVSLSLWIDDILEISEIDGSLDIKFGVYMTWIDYRITFHNLKLNSANTISGTELASIWIPQLIFRNTRMLEETVTNDNKVILTVQRNGTFSKSGNDIVHEIMVFEGIENPLNYERAFRKIFQCHYDMRMYPFDSQTCYIDLILKRSDEDFVDIVPDIIEMRGDTELLQYQVLSWKIGNHQFGSKVNGVRVTIVFGRKILNQILTVYVPTLLIIVIVYSTNFFKDFFFEAVVTVNLTGMLVLTTMYLSVAGGLPQTSYIKMVEIWLLFTLMVPFVEVILHVYMDSLRVSLKDSSLFLEVDSWAR